jgi:mRNA interferase MazF
MARRPKVTRAKRGEVYLVTFDPTMGAEIQKRPPAFIVQHDLTDWHRPMTIVAAIPSQFDEPLYPTEVLFQPPEGDVMMPSVVLLNQIRLLDQQRRVRSICRYSCSCFKSAARATSVAGVSTTSTCSPRKRSRTRGSAGGPGGGESGGTRSASS